MMSNYRIILRIRCEASFERNRWLIPQAILLIRSSSPTDEV